MSVRGMHFTMICLTIAAGFVKAAVIGNKGYGFLDFDSHSAASMAMKAMQEQPVPGTS
jgi:hypothetical protein